MRPDASQAAASATADHHQNKLQNHANASKAAASATANHHQNTLQNHTKTQRHTTHEKCLTSLSEALKEEVTPPRQRPDCIWRRWVQMHLHQCSRFRNGEPPSEQAPTPRKCIQSSRFRNSKPASEHAPKPHKKQRHTTHEKCITSLSEALKEEVTPPRQRPEEDASRCIPGRRFRNGKPPSEQASKPRKCIQSSRFRNSKPPSEHAPKPRKNAAPRHPRKVPNVAF